MKNTDKALLVMKLIMLKHMKKELSLEYLTRYKDKNMLYDLAVSVISNKGYSFDAQMLTKYAENLADTFRLDLVNTLSGSEYLNRWEVYGFEMARKNLNDILGMKYRSIITIGDTTIPLRVKYSPDRVSVEEVRSMINLYGDSLIHHVGISNAEMFNVVENCLLMTNPDRLVKECDQFVQTFDGRMFSFFESRPQNLFCPYDRSDILLSSFISGDMKRGKWYAAVVTYFGPVFSFHLFKYMEYLLKRDINKGGLGFIDYELISKKEAFENTMSQTFRQVGFVDGTVFADIEQIPEFDDLLAIHSINIYDEIMRSDE